MRYFYGALAVVTAILMMIVPEKALMLLPVSLLVGGLLAFLPEE